MFNWENTTFSREPLNNLKEKWEIPQSFTDFMKLHHRNSRFIVSNQNKYASLNEEGLDIELMIESFSDNFKEVTY